MCSPHTSSRPSACLPSPQASRPHAQYLHHPIPAALPICQIGTPALHSWCGRHHSLDFRLPELLWEVSANRTLESCVMFIFIFSLSLEDFGVFFLSSMPSGFPRASWCRSVSLHFMVLSKLECPDPPLGGRGTSVDGFPCFLFSPLEPLLFRCRVSWWIL